jgi:precorrin-6B methylase 1
MAETLQQTQTLSLRTSEVLRKRLEDIRKLTALRKGENVSTSEIAKQLLESSREERFEVVERLNRPVEALLEIRRKGEAGQMLTRAQWTVVAYFVRQWSEALSKIPSRANRTSGC